jgi:hypothetical protein
MEEKSDNEVSLNEEVESKKEFDSKESQPYEEFEPKGEYSESDNSDNLLKNALGNKLCRHSQTYKPSVNTIEECFGDDGKIIDEERAIDFITLSEIARKKGGDSAMPPEILSKSKEIKQTLGWECPIKNESGERTVGYNFFRKLEKLISENKLDEFGLSESYLKEFLYQKDVKKSLKNVVALYNMGSEKAFYFMNASEARVAITAVNKYRKEQIQKDEYLSSKIALDNILLESFKETIFSNAFYDGIFKDDIIKLPFDINVENSFINDNGFKIMSDIRYMCEKSNPPMGVVLNPSMHLNFKLFSNSNSFTNESKELRSYKISATSESKFNAVGDFTINYNNNSASNNIIIYTSELIDPNKVLLIRTSSEKFNLFKGVKAD